MKFSVLIAHFNNSKYFKDCYDSLLKQTYQNWEAIILDDASDPDEKKAVKEMIAGDSRFIYYENEKNSGVGITKSKLIELANGAICGFVDPDDALTSTAIEESIKKYKDNTVIATYSKFYNCNEKLIPINFFKHTRRIKNGNPLFFNVEFEVAHFFTFKKEVYFKTNKINKKLTSSVDQDLYLKLYEKGVFRFINKPLYYYRLHEKGVSQEKNLKNKLYNNWHKVLFDTLQRRNIMKLYDKEISEIENLPAFIKEKQNTFLKKLLRKINV